MTGKNTQIVILPCIDSPSIAASRRVELDIARSAAAALGRSAVEAARDGYYLNRAGDNVDWRLLVQSACAAKRSVAPNDRLPVLNGGAHCSRDWSARIRRPLAETHPAGTRHCISL